MRQPFLWLVSDGFQGLFIQLRKPTHNDSGKQNKEKNKKKAGIVELHQKRPPLRKEGRPCYRVVSDDQYSIFERRT